MKKAALILLAVFSCLAVSAQYVSTSKVGSANSWTGFTADGVSKLVLCEGNTVTIYNDDFTVDRTLTFNLADGEVITFLGDTGATQHLFNNDDLIEVVVAGSDPGYKIVNENNEVLGVIPAPNLMTVGQKNYIYEWDRETESYTLYAIENKPNSLVSVRKVQNIRVFPNPVNRGETLHFQLTEGSIDNVNVYNVAGATELRTVGGEGTLEVPADRLSTGVHPYTVTDNAGNTHSGKVIVK